VPVAFVCTGRTVAAQRESRTPRLEQAAGACSVGTLTEAGITAVDCHQAVPVVVTEPERITAGPAGAAGAVWRGLGRDGWQTSAEARDNPGGERLYQVRLPQARRRREEREAAHQDRAVTRGPTGGTGCAGRTRRRPPTVRRLSASRAAMRRKPKARQPRRRP
jgi:hypothetical protein